MAQNLPSHAFRYLSSRVPFHSPHPSQGAIFSRQLRCSSTSTFTTASGRVLNIIKGAPTSSSCDCDIQFPQGLEIDRNRPIINTVGSYNQHIVIATGKNDWESRIENEEGFGEVAKAFKDMTKVKGEWFDPNYSTLISNSSFNHDPIYGASNPTDPSATTSSPEDQETAKPHISSTSLKLFPHFLHFPHINKSLAHFNHIASSYLGDQTLSPPSAPDPPPSFALPQPITKPTILICSHGSRDMRCGVLGPLLYGKFLEHAEAGMCDVGMISHIGGHAFAGNVVVYMPPGYPLSSGASEGREHTSPLAGMGIWYGRVEPRHVLAILEETVRRGNIIGDLWRGGLDVSAGGREGGWRGRTAGARILRIPSDILQGGSGDRNVATEADGREQVLDMARRVELIGLRAREQWERQR